MKKDKEYSVKIRTEHTKKHKGFVEELDWTEKERNELALRISKLRDDQIAALTEIVHIYFSRHDIADVVKEIKQNGLGSGHADIVIYEADSKENLFWWLNYFENANKKRQ